MPEPHSTATAPVADAARSAVPTFYVSSFNVSATSNEVVVIGSEVNPTWGADGTTHAPVAMPRVVLRLSPQSLKDLADILQNFVAKYEASYGELHTDYLMRKAGKPACPRRAIPDPPLPPGIASTAGRTPPPAAEA